MCGTNYPGLTLAKITLPFLAITYIPSYYESLVPTNTGDSDILDL